MGLAAYGEPLFVNDIYQIIDVKRDGSFCLHMQYFSFRDRFQMWSKKFEVLFGKPRQPQQSIAKRDKDLAASIQCVTEEIYLKMLNYLYLLTKTENLCVSGGVALNAVANGKIYTQTPFKNVYILGAAGDSGSAIGCALFVYHSLLGLKDRHPITALNFGTSYTNEAIEVILKKHTVRYEKFNNENTLLEETALLLARNKIVGWFQEQMEFGPRALGSRSILANPSPHTMKEKVNKIKRREQFRPFAGSILQEQVSEYFKVPEKNHASPFMNFCFAVREGRQSKLAAIVHHDGSCRVQTVNKNNGRYYLLIKKFYEHTGIPCLLNTSFNLGGEPIVENPQQALEDFKKTTMDYLVIGDFLVSKINHKE